MHKTTAMMSGAYNKCNMKWMTSNMHKTTTRLNSSTRTGNVIGQNTKQQAYKMARDKRRHQGAMFLTAAAGGNGSEQLPHGYEYDLITIGAGSGGVRCSRMSAANYGAKVAIVELPLGFVSSERVGGAGGTCVLRGCVPKKLMIYGGEFSHQAVEGAGFGWKVPEGIAHDWSTLQEKKNTELRRLNGIYMKLLSNAGVDYMEGRGTLVDAHTVDIDGKSVTANKILVAVGGTPFKPDIPGKELAITSDEALVLEECPKKIVVVGGGYIALEFAGIFHSFGAEVHVMFRQPLPLRGFDEEVRQFVMDQMALQGIHFHTECSPVSLEKLESGSIKLTTSTGVLEADTVMMATGRKPNTKSIGLDKVGVEVDRNGVIKVHARQLILERKYIVHGD